MAFLLRKIRRRLAGGSFAEPGNRETSAGSGGMQRIWGIRLKLTLITLALIALTTFGSALVIISTMNDFLMNSMVKRGASVALSAATPAGFSILADDRLALDNLAAKIVEAQPDVAYMAIVDHKGNIAAHNQLSAAGREFEVRQGPVVYEDAECRAKKVTRNGLSCYEIQTPIRFADSKVGEVIVGLKAAPLLAAKAAARRQTILIAVLALLFGTAATLLLASLFTAPIKRLANGVSQVKSGDTQVELRISSRDELGELTRSFNEMSKALQIQKESLEDYAHNLEASYTSMVRILAAALDARDKYTLGHSARVAWLSLQIGKKIGMNREELQDLEMACFLHDIGKIKVPDMILAKDGELSESEYEVIKQHPIYGADILSLSDSLHKYIPPVLHHHEWHNGQGYPHGLKGGEIHLYAQIVAITDCFDAMTSSRPYRKGRSRDAAAAEIKSRRGIQFSPHLVDIFLHTLNDINEVQEIPFAGEAL